MIFATSIQRELIVPKIKSIRLQELKSIRDSGTIELKPINILVGMNSVGKSTFLRAFPLLRQSIERRTRGPILWNGEYTDFESFDTALNSNAANESDINSHTIKISFEFTVPELPRYSFRRKANPQSEINVKAQISIVRGKEKFTSFTKQYDVSINGSNFTLTFNEEGTLLEVNSPNLRWQKLSEYFKFVVPEIDSLLPFIDTDRYRFKKGTKQEITSILYRQITNEIKRLSGSVSDRKTSELADKLILCQADKSEQLEVIKKYYLTQKWERTIKQWSDESSDFTFIAGLCDLIFLLENSRLINFYLSNMLKGIRYVAPLRASTERYYRFQDLSVEEVDHQGKNLAMFISAIKPNWKKRLDTWTLENFNFKINKKFTGSNLSLELNLGNEDISDNIADLGFGFSQILPVLVNLWAVSSGYEDTLKTHQNIHNQRIFVIEQPELHLHPAMQAQISDVFQKAILLASENNIDLKLIVETHSPALISKLGDMVSEEQLSVEDINILIFEQDRNLRETKIKYSRFDSDGCLTNWPTGFMSY